WAQFAYQAYMKELPDRAWIGTVPPKPPSEAMKSWVKGYNVRRAKSKRRFG
ncbi:MAG: ATP-dependent helicase, partial [Nevskiaceae bacterium]